MEVCVRQRKAFFVTSAASTENTTIRPQDPRNASDSKKSENAMIASIPPCTSGTSLTEWSCTQWQLFRVICSDTFTSAVL